MIPSNLISKKRDGDVLTKDEISVFFTDYLSGNVTDAQMSAMLMAIYFNGMEEREIFTLVEVMLHSGSILNFPDLEKHIADKHSTGGIGDKISFILAPIMAAAGIKVPMIAGRGLGFTGGTVDKLESIHGINTSPDINTFMDWVNEIGYAIISQSNQICSADKKLYDLRSKTGTVPSIPLICGSIMSKKIAEGLNGLVLDIKVGNGTFMKTISQAKKLGSLMKKIGDSFDIKTDVIYTNMNQPLGRFAGLACEIQESIDCLKGNGPKDLMDITISLGSRLLIQSGQTNNKSEAIKIQEDLIESGVALRKFESSVEKQGGILDEFKFKNKPKYEKLIYLNKEGIISEMNTEMIGWALVQLGCVKKNNFDNLDFSAGIEFIKKVGDYVCKSEPVFRLFNSNKDILDKVDESIRSTVLVSDNYEKNPVELFL